MFLIMTTAFLPRQALRCAGPRGRATMSLSALCLGAAILIGGSGPGLATPQITHTALYTFDGDRVGDRFGWSVSGAGDVDGDGFDDVIVGSSVGGANNGGYARILSGADGSTLYTFDGDSADDEFGISVSGAGDVNRDGFDDVIIGARAVGDECTSRCSAQVLPGHEGSALYIFDGGAADDYFGHSVSGAGDVNGDGYADLIVGALRDNTANGTDSGSARVLSGDDGRILYTFNGDSAFDRLGTSVSGAGDVNRDGFDDVIVGAATDDPNGSKSGSARLLSGDDGSILYTFKGVSADDIFGHSVSGAGDINGDGHADLIVGAWGDDNNGDGSGSARVLSGADGSTLYSFNGDSAGDQFGVSVSGAGDVNGDGYDDLIVGAPDDDPNGSNSGSARVLSGADGSALYICEGDALDAFGLSVSGAGDVNRDGIADFIVGARNGGANRGAYARLFVSSVETSDVPTPGALALLTAGLAALRLVRRR